MKETKLIQVFKKLIDEDLQGSPYFWYKIPDTKGLGGMRPCDVILICNSKVFCLEFKVRNNQPTDWQSFFLAKMRSAGAYACVIRDNDYLIALDKIINIIEEKKK